MSFLYSNIYKNFFDIGVFTYYVVLYSFFLALLYIYIKFIKDENFHNLELNNIEYIILTIVSICNLVTLMLLGDYSSRVSITLIFVVVLSDLCYVFLIIKSRKRIFLFINTTY